MLTGHMIRTILICFFSVFLWSSDASAELRFATWNIEHLGSPGEGCLLRDDSDYLAIRDYLNVLEADVIAFQEVASFDAARRVFPEDRWDLVLTHRPFKGERPLCWLEIPLTQDEPNRLGDLQTGFAVRKSVSFTVHPTYKEIGDTIEGKGEEPYAADISIDVEGRVLRLLSVHLHAGCPVGEEDMSTSCSAIHSQAMHIRRWVDDQQTDAETLILLGDFNRVFRRDDPFWRNALPLGVAQVAVSAEGMEQNCLRRPEFIDHVVIVHPAHFKFFFGQQPLIRFDAKNHLISDHCPVFVDLQ